MQCKERIFFIIVLIVVLPLLAESIYSPGLPALGNSFQVSDTLAETTLSIYLFGMAFGVAFWGNISDVVGRRPVILAGLILFLVATCVCYWTQNFYYFLLFRFLQAFGGSVSCVSQSINRDIFSQRERMALSARIGTAVSIAPAIGAMLGGVVTQYAHWRMGFICLWCIGFCAFIYVYGYLGETKCQNSQPLHLMNYPHVLWLVIQDRILLGNATIIGLGLGILYAFMSEGAFYCIENMMVSVNFFGLICALGSLVYALGCRASSYWIHKDIAYVRVMKWGVCYMICGLLSMLVNIFLHQVGFFWTEFASHTLIMIFLGLWMVVSFGLSLILTPCFANALENQLKHAGVAASVFAFIYSLISALINIIVSYFHSDGLYRMPMIFLVIVFIIAFACDTLYQYLPYSDSRC